MNAQPEEQTLALDQRTLGNSTAHNATVANTNNTQRMKVVICLLYPSNPLALANLYGPVKLHSKKRVYIIIPYSIERYIYEW